MIIVVSGFRGSGKSLFGKLAKRLHFPVFEMSEPILALMKEFGLETNNESVRNFATDFREKGGHDAVAKLLLPKIKVALDTKKNVVIIGARSMDEVEIFRPLGETITVALISAEKVRFARVQERGKPTDPKKIADFKWADEMEEKWGLRRLVEGSDVKIENNTSEQEFEKKAKRFLEKYK